MPTWCAGPQWCVVMMSFRGWAGGPGFAWWTVHEYLLGGLCFEVMVECSVHTVLAFQATDSVQIVLGYLLAAHSSSRESASAASLQYE